MIGFLFGFLVIFVNLFAFSFAPDIAGWVSWTALVIALLCFGIMAYIGVRMVMKRKLV